MEKYCLLYNYVVLYWYLSVVSAKNTLKFVVVRTQRNTVPTYCVEGDKLNRI